MDSNPSYCKRKLIERIANDIAQFYDDWYDVIGVDNIDSFIDEIAPLVKRDAQNALDDIQTV